MHTIYFLAEVFPFWGIPLALIMFEVGRSYSQRGHKLAFVFCLLFSLILLGGSIYHISLGPDKVRNAMQKIERDYGKIVHIQSKLV